MTRAWVVLLCCAVLLAGCGGPKRKAGGYYKDDGPGSNIPANIQAIPNAVPRIEAHRPANARPYVVMGRRYTPISNNKPFRQVGIASWYGRKFHGKKTANGETYDMYAMTAAHPTLPLPSYARVTSARSRKSVIVRINDRGPFHSSRIIDLSYVAAAKLDLIGPGSGQVIVEAITHDDIRNNSYMRADDAQPQPQPIPDAAPPSTPLLITQAQMPAQPQAAAAPADAPKRQDAAATPDALSILEGQGTPPRNAPPRSATDVSPPDGGARATTVAHSPSGIFLQFGAFGAHDNATRLAARINDEIAHIEQQRARVASSDSLHKVQIGPYSNRTQAVNAALRIQTATGLKATFSGPDATPPSAQRSL